VLGLDELRFKKYRLDAMRLEMWARLAVLQRGNGEKVEFGIWISRNARFYRSFDILDVVAPTAVRAAGTVEVKVMFHWEEVDEVAEAEEVFEILDDDGCEVIESTNEEIRVYWRWREHYARI
jgi:hypothetical protein